jgi:hypothetical protein
MNLFEVVVEEGSFFTGNQIKHRYLVRSHIELLHLSTILNAWRGKFTKEGRIENIFVNPAQTMTDGEVLDRLSSM